MFLPLTISCIESLVSWEATFNEFKSFLTFNEVKTDGIYWQFHKVSVDVTNITEVSLKQDFKTFFVSQEFVVEDSRRELFSSAVKSFTRAASSNWMRVAPSSANLAKNVLVSSH